MKTASIQARVRCQHCKAKVSLTPAQVQELSRKLALILTCPACGQRFTKALLREPDEVPPVPVVPSSPASAAPVPSVPSPPTPLLPPGPVPAGPPVPVPFPVHPTPRAEPPFRPLIKNGNPGAASPAPPPLTTHFAPRDDPYAPPDSALSTPKAGGWWKNLSPTNQKLILVGVVAVFALGLIVMKSLKSSPAPVDPADIPTPALDRNTTNPERAPRPEAEPETEPEGELPPAPPPTATQAETPTETTRWPEPELERPRRPAVVKPEVPRIVKPMPRRVTVLGLTFIRNPFSGRYTLE